jgi:uncharacterized protein
MRVASWEDGRESMAETPRGRFVWYELLTSDPEAAQRFYTRLFDWGTQAFEGSGPEPYTMWTNKGTLIGGVMRLPEPARQAGSPSHWLAYIGTPNVDETVEQAQKLGARVHVPARDIPTVGRFAVLLDPQGAAFAVFTPAPSSSGGPQGPPPTGGFSWHELSTTDHEAALRFYQTLFGWEKLSVHDMGEMGTYIIYGLAGTPFGGMFKKGPGMPTAFVLYVKVEDAEAGVEKVKELGGRIVNGPMEVPGGDRIAIALDPQGAPFALHAMARKPQGSEAEHEEAGARR